MINTTLFTHLESEAQANRQLNIKSEVFKGPDIRIEGNLEVNNYNILEVLGELLKKDFPDYLLEKVRIVFSTETLKDYYYTEINIDNKIVQEVWVELSLHNLASKLYGYFNSENKLPLIVGFEQDDPPYEVIDKIEAILLKGEKVEVINTALVDMLGNKTYKRQLIQLIQLHPLFHELMHAFLCRIYPSDPKEVSLEDEKEFDTQEQYRILEQIEDRIAEEDIAIDIEKTDLETLAQLNKRIMKEILSIEDFLIDQDKKLVTFRGVYIGGIQEVWVRLLEARLNIINEESYFADPENKYNRTFQREYRSGHEIVEHVVERYMGNTIFVPLDILNDLLVVDPLTVDFIDQFIKDKILPLMDKEKIIEAKKEYMPYLR